MSVHFHIYRSSGVTNRISSLIVGLLMCFPLFAEGTDTLSVSVYFRQGSSLVERGFRDNGVRLDAFVSKVNGLLSDSLSLVHSVSVSTGASPEGSLELNERLSMDRARSIRDYILNGTLLSPSQVKVSSLGVDWELFSSLVESSDCPWKEDIRRLLSMPVTYKEYRGGRLDSRKIALQQLDGGRCWEWLYENIFEQMRSAAGEVRCVFQDRRIVFSSDARVSRDTMVVVLRDTIFVSSVSAADSSVALSVPARKVRSSRVFDSSLGRTVFAFRSNLLVPLLNVGMEVPVGNRFSIGADIYCPWVLRDWMNRISEPQRYCMQGIMGGVEFRYWPGLSHKGGNARYNRLCGHSVALVADAGIFDMEYDWKGVQGEFAIIGFDYTYALPVKSGKVCFEFSLGVGYCLCRWRPYEVYYEGGLLISERPAMLWQGPMASRIGVSLIIPVRSKDRRMGK